MADSIPIEETAGPGFALDSEGSNANPSVEPSVCDESAAVVSSESPSDGKKDLNINNKIKHRKGENGLLNHVLRSSEDYDPAESGDSGRGSSCHEHECECGAEAEAGVADASAALAVMRVGGISKEEDSVASCSGRDIRSGIEYVVYESEKQMPDIMRLITKDLSEPYSIYTYRYFIHNWPKLCFLVSWKGYWLKLLPFTL